MLSAYKSTDPTNGRGQPAAASTAHRVLGSQHGGRPMSQSWAWPRRQCVSDRAQIASCKFPGVSGAQCSWIASRGVPSQKAPFVMMPTSLSARGDGGTRLAMNERTRKGSFACPFACDHAHEPMCMWAGRASMRACHSHCGLLWASRHRHERSQSTVVDTERISEGLVTL